MSTIRDAKTTNRGCKNFHIEMFDNADEVTRTCAERKVTNSSFHDMRKYDIYKSWHGVDSYDEALDLMKTGYQPTVESMKGLFNARLAGEGKRFKMQNNVHGFAPIVPLALKGVPNSMMNMTMTPIKAKVIDVYYDSTVTCGISPEKQMEAGKMLLSTIIELEQQGYRFNLYAVQSYCDRESIDMMVVKMKSATQPLDIKRTSFPLTHTGFFRVIGFDWYSKCPGAKYRSGYGTDITRCVEDLSTMAKDLFGKTAIYFSAAEMVKKDKTAVKETITNAECKVR